MRSLILIPSYLWKNTLKRWLENPVSPLSKVLVPLLLGLLATLVLVFFAEVEAQLSKQLKEGNSFDVHISEQAASFDNTLRAEISYEEEELWLSKYGSKDFYYLRQSFTNVEWKKARESLPVIIYNNGFPELQKYREDTKSPTIWLLTKYPDSVLSKETVKLGGKSITAIPIAMPQKIAELVQADNILAAPIEMAGLFLRDGFTIHIHARFQNLDEVRTFVNETRAYHRAEKRNVRTYSSLYILEGLAKINEVQNYIRLGIVGSCGIILAIILGTIAWLEYRQEAYLLALLRSFGTPRLLLITHAFLENIILVTLGIYIAFISWKPIYNLLQSKVTDMNLSPAENLALGTTDMSIILVAGLFGVLVAMIPIAIGLRKPAGLILQ